MEEESKDTLGDRMKAYEAKVTEEYLDMGMPMYARIDGRAFHTLCRGMKKPFDHDFVTVMHETCRHLVKETGANLGYVQSDEISLGWVNPSKAPFGGRVFKLTSVLASIAGAAFMKEAVLLGGTIKDRALHYVPNFDCRIFNLPSVEELVNAFVWRQNDCIKNAVSSIANSMFSVKELNRKNQAEQQEMIRAKGNPFESYPEHLRIGSFFKRVNVLRAVTDPDIIPKIRDDCKFLNDSGEVCVMRSEVTMIIVGRITELEDRAKILFDYVQEEEK